MTIENKETVIAGEGDLKDEKTLDNAGEAVADDKKNDDEDKKLSDVINPLLEGDEEEEITVKRGALKKLHTSKENYKTVAVAAKKKKDPIVPKVEETKLEEKFVTKASVEKKNTKDAITQATVAVDTDDDSTKELKKEINDNFDEIKKYYTGKGGKEDVTAIYTDILDAHAIWKRRNGSSGKKNSGDNIAADLAATRGTGGRDARKPVTERKGGILPKSGSPKDTWYPKKTE